MSSSGLATNEFLRSVQNATEELRKTLSDLVSQPLSTLAKNAYQVGKESEA